MFKNLQEWRFKSEAFHVIEITLIKTLTQELFWD